jgi:hypothetical protein
MPAMSLRPPRNLSTHLVVETGASVLDAEILAEKAAALGRAGEAVEKTLTALRDSDPQAAHRDLLLTAAADAVWAFFIQRELCGLRDQQQVIADYAIPGAVLARLGAMKREPG